MESVFRFVSDGAAELGRHPFFTWVRESPVPLRQRLAFLPALAPFAMGYRDVCTLALPYPAEQDDFQRAINLHAAEDATHSGLFLEDWAALDLDGQLGWGAGDVLWWLFAAGETAAARRAGTRLYALAVADGGDPLLRAAWSEAIEACGAVFFRVLAPLADELVDPACRYLGSYHLARESGHIESHDLFADCELAPERRELAIGFAAEVLGLFGALFDSLLQYVLAYTSQGRFPRRPAAGTRARLELPGVGRQPCDLSGSPVIGQILGSRRRQTERHPLYQWLAASAGPSAQARLSAVVPEWALGIMGYPEVLHVLSDAAGGPVSGAVPGAVPVRAWADSLAWHGEAFLADWDALNLDQRLGLTASQALHWLYLDPRTDAHRRNLAAFIRLAASCVSPLARMWLLEALEASGDAWFTATSALAVRAERDLGKPLDYLAGRCESPSPDRGGFASAPLRRAEEEQVASAITTVFDAVDEQLDLTLAGVAGCGS
jgi:hypothetical protein